MNVPRLFAPTREATTLGMIMQGLGRSVRVPDEEDGAATPRPGPAPREPCMSSPGWLRT